MCKKLLIFVLMFGLVSTAIGQPTGDILFEYWFDIGGVNLADLTSQAAYPDDPDDGELRTAFDGPLDWQDNYGTRVRGYLYPPKGGDYTFWVSGDDCCDLYLSTDNDPANAVLIAQVAGWTSYLQWDKYPEQQSAYLTLSAGGKYYIEGLMKEGGGGDSFTVGWTGPGIGEPNEITVIDGAYLSPAETSIGLQKAKNPVPADGAVDVDVALLEWTAGVSATSHVVYLNGELLAETEMTLVAADLAPGTAYTWRVDEVQEDGTVIEGDTWSFTTLPLEAHFPNPADGATDIGNPVTLSWTAGKNVIMHDLYFGTDEAAIAERNMTTFKGKLITPSYDPGELELTTYYWAVDQFTPTGTVLGPVWSFAMKYFLDLDDFESYSNEEGERIFDTWADGGGWASRPPPEAPLIPSNDTGAIVGHDIWSPDTPYTTIMETEIVYSGNQSMPVYYDNSESPYYSQVDRTWEELQDWTVDDINILSLWVHGSPGNDPAQFYIAVEDRDGNVSVVSHPNLNLLQRDEWIKWKIVLSNFDGRVDLKEVKKISIGMRDVPNDGLKILANSAVAANGNRSVIFVEDVQLSSGVAPPGLGLAWLWVVVVDATVDPTNLTSYRIGKATVRIKQIDGSDSDELKTGSSGLCTFLPLLGEYYRVTVEKKDYWTASEEIFIDDDKQAMAKLVPVKPVQLTGLNIGDFEGSSTENNGTWNIEATKNPSNPAGLWWSSDSFHYIYRVLSGDGYIEAHVAEISSDQSTYTSWCEAGVMIRDTLEADSSYAMTINMKGTENGNVFKWRENKGGETNATAPSAENSWVRMERKGDQLTGYLSDNGDTWTQLGDTQNIIMEDDVYVGIGVTVSWYDYNESEEKWTCEVDCVDIGQLP